MKMYVQKQCVLFTKKKKSSFSGLLTPAVGEDSRVKGGVDMCTLSSPRRRQQRVKYEKKEPPIKTQNENVPVYSTKIFHLIFQSFFMTE